MIPVTHRAESFPKAHALKIQSVNRNQIGKLKKR